MLTRSRVRIMVAVLAAFSCGHAMAAEPPAAFNADNAFFAIRLPGFFAVGSRKGAEPDSAQMKLYLVRRGGKWVAAAGNSNNDRGRASYNTSLFPVDASGLKHDDGKLSGAIIVVLPPDPWVPDTQKAHKVVLTVEAQLQPPRDAKTEKASLAGTYKATIDGTAAELEAASLTATREGPVVGGIGETGPADANDVSLDLVLSNFVPGTSKVPAPRRRALSIGIKSGKALSARLGQVDIRHNAYDYQVLPDPSDVTFNGDAFSGTVKFASTTLDGDEAAFTVQVEGQRVVNWAVGSWKGKYTDKSGVEKDISGYFKGTINKGAFVPDKTAIDDRPWFTVDRTATPFKPGEHPRLFFRAKDVEELRRRAETPDGQRILKRLRESLDGANGDTLPTSYNPATRAYAGNFDAKPGAYTIYHAAGYGFLYQLTGEKKYADLARQCVEKGFAGQRSSDDRYAWVAPGGELRAGPSIGWTAVAYDLCYEAWPEDFRRKVALAIQNYEDEKGGEWNNPENITMRKLALTPAQGPASNHFGAVVGGAGLAILAIANDPGTDEALITKYMTSLEKQVPRQLSAGWGDGGYFKEGWGPANVGHHQGFLNFVQALRVAKGHDYGNVERQNLANTVLVPYCRMMVGPPARFPYRSDMGSTYGGSNFMSERSWYPHFCDAFGVLTDDQKAAYLWTWQNVVMPDRSKDDFDAASSSPHRAMLALINWPTFRNITAKNPGEVLKHWSHDTVYDYFVFRNRWKDKNDIVVTLGTRLPDGTKPRDVLVWGFGEELTFGEPPRGVKVTHFVPGVDGSAVITAGNYAFAVDFSKSSGADALLISTGTPPRDVGKSDKVRIETVKAGDATFNVLTLSAESRHPTITPQADGLTVGGQSVKFSDGKLTLATFKPESSAARTGGIKKD